LWWGKLIHWNTCNTQLGGEQLGGEQRYPPQVQASTESDHGYMYPDESSRVVVYCLNNHNMLGWFECMVLWNYIWFNGWTLLCSSLPYFLCCVICCVILSFAMIINLLVWADARNTRRQQGVEIPLHSPCGLVYISVWVYLGLRPTNCSSLDLCTLVIFSSSFFLGIVVCHGLYGVEFKTPKLRLYVIFFVTLALISRT